MTDKNGQFSTASNWASHKRNTNAGKSSEDGIWFGTSEPDDSKGALLYDTYEIEELACESNKGMKLIPAFEVVVSRNKVTIDLGTLTDMNLVSVGTINASLVIPREVFKSSILANASAIIGLHNHPSGNVKPSKEDMIVTRKLQKCGQLLGIELLDHIIVGGTNGKMLSFREEKMLNVTGRMDWEREL